MKILVAEDDKFLVKAYHAKFTNAGFDIQIATDGEEFEKKLESFVPDVILLDLMMPKKDGFEVLKAVRKAQSKRRLMKILYSENLHRMIPYPISTR